MMSSTIQRSASHPAATLPLCRIPADLSVSWRLADGTPVLLRPMLPTDGPRLASFIAGLSPASRHARRQGAVASTTGSMPAEPLSDFGELVEPDYEQHVGYVITVPDEGSDRIIGEACFISDGNSGSADIALVLADAWQRHGIGTRVLLAMARAAGRRGLRWLRADVAAGNRRALHMLQRCGFISTPHPDDEDRMQLHLLLLPPFPGA
jgi:acetyltransferase